MADPTSTPRAVFLSYASEDAAAAKRICDALRTAGVEVWFDSDGGLEHGDEWDAKIRRQIKECVFFLPVISRHTQARLEGYFRIEWELAAERAMGIAHGVPFLLPLVIDGTRETEALVPERFHKVQWTRLPDGVVPPEALARFFRIWAQRTGTAVPAGEPAPGAAPAAASPSTPAARPASRWAPWAIGAVLAVAAAAFLWSRHDAPAPVAAPAPAATPAPAPAAPDAKSVAVLAFADLSEGHNSEFFSDGISEELLNVLAKVPGLRVAARTSAFYFKGKNLPVGEIAAKLGVAYVVEGSVQRSGDSVRITAQLIKASDGYHVWSEHFDRELKNVFAVQDEIAGLIAHNLSLKLGAAASPAVAVDPQAFELYLRARRAWATRTLAGFAEAEKLLQEALAREPGFARAHAALADVWEIQGDTLNQIGGFNQRNSPELARIRAEIDRALQLDPDLAEAHASLGSYSQERWQFPEAIAHLRQAIALNPNYASAHQWLARALHANGQADEALAEMRLAAALDPLSHRIQDNLAMLLESLGRPAEGLAAAERALALMPDSPQALNFQALCLDRLGRYEEALGPARRSVASDPSWKGPIFRVFVHAHRAAEADAIPQAPGPLEHWFGLLRALALDRTEEACGFLDAEHIAWRDAGRIVFGSEFDPLRGDPRFGLFLEQLGLTAANERAQAWRAAHPPVLR